MNIDKNGKVEKTDEIELEKNKKRNMNRITQLLNNDNARLILSIGIFLVALAIIIILYKYIIKKLTIRVGRSQSRLDDFVVEVLRLPFLGLMIWTAVRIFSVTAFYDTRFMDAINHGMRILLLITIGWILVKFNGPYSSLPRKTGRRRNRQPL